MTKAQQFEWLNSLRTKHSPAFVRGAEAGIQSALHMGGIPCPYKPGSAGADAWDFGWIKGMHRAITSRPAIAQPDPLAPKHWQEDAA